MATAVSVINTIKESILCDDCESITNSIQLLPITALPRNSCDILLNSLLEVCYVNNKTAPCKQIIDAFELARYRIDPVHILTTLFLNTSISKDTLEFVLQCYSTRTITDYMIDVINMTDDTTAVKLANSISHYFKDVPNETWLILLNLTDDFEDVEYRNPMLRAFLQSKVSETGSFITPPNWMKNVDLPKLELYPDCIPSVMEAVTLLLEDITRNKINLLSDIDDEHLKNMLIAQYSISTVIERIKLLSAIKQLPESNDRNIFLEFGPINTVYTINTELLPPHHECRRFGGCRMFLCREFECCYEENASLSEDDELADWFTGCCCICLKRIKSRYHCLRLPLVHGGWRGCYCPGDCIKKDIKDPITAVMFGRILSQLSDIGIRNR